MKTFFFLQYQQANSSQTHLNRRSQQAQHNSHTSTLQPQLQDQPDATKKCVQAPQDGKSCIILTNNHAATRYTQHCRPPTLAPPSAKTKTRKKQRVQARQDGKSRTILTSNHAATHCLPFCCRGYLRLPTPAKKNTTHKDALEDCLDTAMQGKRQQARNRNADPLNDDVASASATSIRNFFATHCPSKGGAPVVHSCKTTTQRFSNTTVAI